MTKCPTRAGREADLARRIAEQSNWYGIQVEERARNGAQLVQKPKRGKGCTICLRITLGFCVSGAAIGCCLLVAGGVYKQHSGHIKILMYIGILVFLVSVALLVILCSSWGTGSDHTPETASKCACRYLTTKKKRRKDFPTSATVSPQRIDTATLHREAETSLTVPIHSPLKPEKPSKRLKGNICSVKNCVCRLQTDNNSGITYRSDFPLNGNNGSHSVNMYEGLQLSSSSSSPFVFNILSRRPQKEPPPPPGSCEQCHHFCQSRKFSGDKIYLYNGYPYFEIQEIPNENEPFQNGNPTEINEQSSKL